MRLNKSKSILNKSSLMILFSIILLSIFVVSVSGIVIANDCCFPPYPSSGDPTFGTDVIVLPPGGACISLPGYTLVEECTDDQGNVKSDFLTQECCCNDTAGTIEDFGASSAGFQPYVIYYKYCDANSFNPKPAANGTCDCTLGSGQGGSGSSSTGMHLVTGNVYFNNTPLPGVTVQAENGFYINGVTDGNGHYNLGNIPGVDNGYNIFTATVPEGYSITIDGDAVVLECPQKTEQRMLSTSYSEDVVVDFNMTCTVQGPACEPDWNVSEWSECKVYGNQYVKTRDVIDLNNCGVATGMPITVLTASTTGPEAQYYDCNNNPLSGTCNNGVLDEGELCDTNSSTGETIYRSLPDYTSASSQAPSCQNAGFVGDNSHYVTCRNDCTYDYSDCVGICDVCDSSKCDICSNCENTPICEQECKNMTVNFLPTYAVSARNSNRDVINSYDTDPETALTGVIYTEGSKDVELRWEIPYTQTSCENKITGYIIKYCEEKYDGETPTNTCKQYSERQVLAKQKTQSIVIKDLLDKNIKSICYNICTATSDGKTYCVYNESEGADDPLACFRVGEPYCFEKHKPGLNCVYDNDSQQLQPTGCYIKKIKENTLVTNHEFKSNSKDRCASNKQCIETEYDPKNGLKGADCVSPGACEVCNGFFGLQASQNLQSFYYGSDDSLQTVDNCEYFEFSEDNSNFPSSDNAIARCYKDKKEKNNQVITPFQYYNTCENVKTCYDYKTKRTCKEDPCFRFTNMTEDGDIINNSCQWNAISDDLGIGVCAPKEEKDQDCFRCDKDSPTGFCNEDLCNAYGDCYFKELQHHNLSTNVKKEERIFNNDNYLYQKLHDPFLSTCINKRDVACYFYQSEEDCIGANKQNNSLDVVYNESGDRVAGTNERINYSNDTFQIGMCKWINDTRDVGCYKDSDDYYTKSTRKANYSDDCFDGSNAKKYNLNCLQDITPPNTTILLRKPIEHEDYVGHNGTYLPVYGINELSNISFVVEDNILNPAKNPQTFISIMPYNKCVSEEGCDAGVDETTALNCRNIGCEVYSRYKLEDYQKDGSQYNVLDNKTTQEYEIIYYSEDNAKNLEVLKKDYFMIDLTEPSLTNFSTNVTSYNIYGDIYASDLEINFTISENSFCEGYLYSSMNNTYQLPGQNVANSGTNFHASYKYLEDGYYNFTIFCHDDFENNLITSKEILVEGNAAITNPQPRGQIFTDLNQVEMSIETQNNGTCKFDEESVPYNQSSFTFQQTGQTIHTQNAASISGNNPEESKPYIYYTSCKFDNGETTEQVPGDIISFTIDKLPPTTEVYFKETPDSDYTIYNMALASWNQTREFKLVCSDFNSAIPIVQFGCKEIQYCFAKGYDESTFTEANCKSPLFTSDSNEVNFEVSYEPYAYDQLYYRSIDNGNNMGSWQRTNMKIKNTYYENPIVYVT